MAGREFNVRPAEGRRPGPGRRGTVLMLPGRAYSCDMSLLARTTRALQASGWAVMQAEWDLSTMPADPRAFVEEVADELDALKRPGEPVLLVAKSLGTLAAYWGADKGYPAVWLTPVLNAAGRYPMPKQSTGLARRIRDYPTLNLVIGGTEDILWRPGFCGTGRVLELDGADHALEVADRGMSDLLHESVASAVVDFASPVRLTTPRSRPG